MLDRIPRRPPFLRAVVAATLCVAIGAPGSIRAAAPQADFEQLIARADEHSGQGQHAEALRAYAEAFSMMPAELKASDVGEFVALAAGHAALDDFRARGEPSSLEEGRTVLLSFIEAVDGVNPALQPASTDAARERLAEIDALVPVDPAAPGESPTPLDASDTLAMEERRDDTTADERQRRLGIGFVVAGGVAAVTGVGLVIAGSRQVPWYEARLKEEGWTPTDEGYDRQIVAAERVRNIDIGLGAVALAIGVGLGVTGAVFLAMRERNGREAATVSVPVPVLRRDRAMLGIMVGF